VHRERRAEGIGVREKEERSKEEEKSVNGTVVAMSLVPLVMLKNNAGLVWLKRQGSSTPKEEHTIHSDSKDKKILGTDWNRHHAHLNKTANDSNPSTLL
jgi:hypothetical protein